MLIEPFTIAVDDDVLTDLRDRVARARWPDIGAGVTVALGRQHPERLIGLHLSAYTFPTPPEPWTPAERAFAEAQEHWLRIEGSYGAQQATKPQTLAYGLTDSPPVSPAGSWRSSGPGATAAVTWSPGSPGIYCSPT